MRRNRNGQDRRRGSIAVLAAVMIVVLVGVLAFAVDYGYLLSIHTNLQRAADAAALAATQDLIRLDDGTQDLDQVRARVRDYVRTNLNHTTFQIPDSDIEIGRYDPSTVYSGVTLLNNGTYDTVRVTLRRDGVSNPLAPVYFGRVLGQDWAVVSVTATAALQKAEHLPPGADILPMATPITLWDDLDIGDTWTGYGDGRIEDEIGNEIPGNWGTLDVGELNNSTSEINDQILNGLRQFDIDALYDQNRIDQSAYIDSSVVTWMSADTGMSTGIKNSIEQVHGLKRLIPIYEDIIDPNGENLEYEVVKWGVVTVVTSVWQGAQHSRVTLMKSHTYSGELRPKPNLDSTTPYIEGAFTSPVLIE